MCPELFHIGPVPIRSFGLMAMLGFLIPLLLMRREFRRREINPDQANQIVTGAIIGGFIGARTYFLVEHWEMFVERPWEMIFSGAGLAWYGGFIGGALAVAFVIKRSKSPGLQLLDVVAPLVLLGYAIGRIGCHLAGDGDYGPPSDLPWAMAYPNGVVPTEIPVHPTPLYDMALSLVLFSILWLARYRIRTSGILIGLSLIALGAERFVTEFFRTLPVVAFGWMSMAQLLSAVVVFGGVVILIAMSNKSFGIGADQIGVETRSEIDLHRK